LEYLSQRNRIKKKNNLINVYKIFLSLSFMIFD
jgi:hypothetical protein